MVHDPWDTTALIEQSKQLVSLSSSLSSPTQVLALLVHSIHSALSFRLVSPQPASASSGDGGAANQAHPNRLPDEWPQSGAELKFKYKHDQSSLEYVVSVIELGGKALVAGAAVDDSGTASLDVPLADYFSTTTLSSSSPLAVADLSPSRPFSSADRLADLVKLYRLNFLQKLVPNLQTDGYSESASSSGGVAGGSPAPAPPVGGGSTPYLPDRGGPMGMFPPARPHNPPSSSSEPPAARPAPQPAPGAPSPDHDPLRIPGSGGRGGFGSPLAEIGRRDLDPLGGMGGTFGGGPLGGGGGFGGMGGLGGLGGGGNGGGMFMGPNHPLFSERFGSGGELGGGSGGRWGGDGYLPPGGAPPVARFDPVGPVNGPPGGSGLGVGPGQAGFHPGPGGQGGQGGAGRGGGSAGGRMHPDLERPGGNSDYDAMFG
ncbi:hypothetical protein JCM10207_000478 [Rhodosporidiobolus poonsookiae]